MGFLDRLFGGRAKTAEETRFPGEKLVVKAPMDGIAPGRAVRPRQHRRGGRQRAPGRHGLRSLRRKGHFHRPHPPRYGAGKHRGHRAAHPHWDRHRRPAGQQLHPAGQGRTGRQSRNAPAERRPRRPTRRPALHRVRPYRAPTPTTCQSSISSRAASSPPARRCSNSSKIQKRHLPSADVFFVMLLLFRAYTAGPARRRGR